MELDKLKTAFKNVSLGEASETEKLLVEALSNEDFSKYLKDFNFLNSNVDFSSLDLYLESSEKDELNKEYKEVIPKDINKNYTKVRLYAKNRGILRRFLKKQRISYNNLIQNSELRLKTL